MNLFWTWKNIKVYRRSQLKWSQHERRSRNAKNLERILSAKSSQENVWSENDVTGSCDDEGSASELLRRQLCRPPRKVLKANPKNWTFFIKLARFCLIKKRSSLFRKKVNSVIVRPQHGRSECPDDTYVHSRTNSR